jgi:hypothetical protein
MAEQLAAPAPLMGHGELRLPSVIIDSYNVELEDDEGFLGDRANKASFREFVENWRKPLREIAQDPFGTTPSGKLSNQQFNSILLTGEPEGAGILQGAIEDFAQELALVIRHFLELKGWKGTQRVAVGGGLRATRIGELIVGRTQAILRAMEVDLDLAPIHNDPDEAGLIGAAHLIPSWMLNGHDAMLSADIGGTNFRAGIVELNLKRSPDLSKAKAVAIELWRHRDEGPNREEAVEELAKMLQKLLLRAEKEGLNLTPLIGIGSPGVIEPDGSIDRGAQNLPGNWESSRFNLPAELSKAIPKIGEHPTNVLMHNDAVIQGLSEVPFMQDVRHWGVLTIGTGLGNARFTNRDPI